MSADTAPLAGQVRRHELLGSLATYRVADVAGLLTAVDVVDVIGLPPGARFRMATEAIATMDVLEAPAD